MLLICVNVIGFASYHDGCNDPYPIRHSKYGCGHCLVSIPIGCYKSNRDDTHCVESKTVTDATTTQLGH